MIPTPCPECRSGKPSNCGGTTWDDTTDGPVPCPGPPASTDLPPGDGPHERGAE